MNFQRRTFGHPDLGILLRRFLRPDIKYDAVQNQPPRPPWKFHHSRITKELLEVWAQRLCSRSIGCTEIDQQYAGPVGCVLLESGFGGNQDSVSKDSG